MRNLGLSVAAGSLLLAMQLQRANAQAPVEWSSIAQISNGTCGDGATAFVSERPGNMHLRLVYPNGQQYAEFDIPLSQDGGGKKQAAAANGAQVLFDVPAGKGKRSMKSSQVTGICQWMWTPK